jgi:hypothetical protein
MRIDVAARARFFVAQIRGPHGHNDEQQTAPLDFGPRFGRRRVAVQIVHGRIRVAGAGGIAQNGREITHESGFRGGRGDVRAPRERGRGGVRAAGGA